MFTPWLQSNKPHRVHWRMKKAVPSRPKRFIQLYCFLILFIEQTSRNRIVCIESLHAIYFKVPWVFLTKLNNFLWHDTITLHLLVKTVIPLTYFRWNGIKLSENAIHLNKFTKTIWNKWKKYPPLDLQEFQLFYRLTYFAHINGNIGMYQWNVNNWSAFQNGGNVNFALLYFKTCKVNNFP